MQLLPMASSPDGLISARGGGDYIHPWNPPKFVPAKNGNLFFVIIFLFLFIFYLFF